MSYSFSKPSSSRPSSSPSNNASPISRGLGADFWESLLQMQNSAAKLQHQHEIDAIQQYSRQYRQYPNSSSVSKPKVAKEVTRVKYPDINNNNNSNVTSSSNEGTRKRSSNKSNNAKKPSKSVSFQENERVWTSVKAGSSRSSPSPRVSTAPPSLQQQFQSVPSSSSKTRKTAKTETQAQNPVNVKTPKKKAFSYPASTRPSSTSSPSRDSLESLGPSLADSKGTLNSTISKDLQIVSPRRKASSKHSTRRHSVTSVESSSINESGGSTISNHGSKYDSEWITENVDKKPPSRAPSKGNNRPHTAPQPAPQSQEQKSSAPVAVISLPGCLKRPKRSNTDNRLNFDNRHLRPDRPAAVTFAPGTINVERENKPKKQTKMKNNRKPKFAHPCSGHFLPPITEIVVSNEPSTVFENPYTKFNTMWCGPMARVSKESVTKKGVRCKRFRNLLSSLSITHESFNSVHEKRKSHLMVNEILPRYIAALDIALMDGEIDHVEQLLTTIISSLTVLQINLHDAFFDKNGKPREIRAVQDDYFVDVGPVIFAMNRIAGDQSKYSTSQLLSIEAQMVKLQLEMMVLCFCPFDCLIFRSQLAVVPGTARMALAQLQEIKHQRSYYSVRWVNDSVMHRDYMSLLKFFGFCDDTGAKSPDTFRGHGGSGRRLDSSNAALSSSMSNVVCNNNQSCGKNNARRPASADPVVMSNSGSQSPISSAQR